MAIYNGDKNELTFKCVGVNHQAFYTVFEHNGEDLYPKLREQLKNEEFYNKEQVRNEMFLKLGYYVTESSGHNSEYNPWFRKRPDLIDKYCTHSTEWNPGEYAFSLNLRLKRQADLDKYYGEWYEREFDKNKSNEYAADIFNARLGDGKPFIFNGNVLNHGSIPNLPDDVCVEVPILAHNDGGVPNIIINIPEISEYYFGYMVYFFEKACAVSGYMLGVNPFDQPGVEAYKKNMFALLGKPGYENEKESLEKML